LANQKEKPAKPTAKPTAKPVDKSSRPVVVDGTNHIAGRLCSNVAKLLLQGNRVSIINSEEIMISGKKKSIFGEYHEFLKIASILHPKHGPFHPRRPDTIITRMVRGMLPRDKPSGMSAFKRLRAYIGTPKELKSLDKIQFEKAIIKKSSSSYTRMYELAKNVGWHE
jgi:large subunit ribosomal protein L13